MIAVYMSFVAFMAVEAAVIVVAREDGHFAVVFAACDLAIAVLAEH